VSRTPDKAIKERLHPLAEVNVTTEDLLWIGARYGNVFAEAGTWGVSGVMGKVYIMGRGRAILTC